MQERKSRAVLFNKKRSRIGFFYFMLSHKMAFPLTVTVAFSPITSLLTAKEGLSDFNL